MKKCELCDGTGIVKVVKRNKKSVYIPCPDCDVINGIEPVKMSKKRLEKIASRTYRDASMTHDLLKHIAFLTVQWRIALL